MGGPKRPPGLDDAALAGIRRGIELRRRPWHDLSDLVERIRKRAEAGMNVTLTPGTASIVAHHLSTVDAKPTRDEVALMICRAGTKNQCGEPCTGCKAVANIVVRAYGARPD